MPTSSISFKCWRTSSYIAGWILWYGSLIGVLSIKLIPCLTISDFPRSVGPLEIYMTSFPILALLVKLDRATSYRCQLTLLTVQGQHYLTLCLTFVMSHESNYPLLSCCSMYTTAILVVFQKHTLINCTPVQEHVP